MIKRNKRRIKGRQRARSLFKVLLAVGFIYQSALFLDMYLKYPAVVELDVFEPPMIELPAVTVCNTNEIRSSAFCRRFPENCSSPFKDPSICDKYERYCKQVGNSTVEVPVVDVSTYLTLTRHEQQEMGHTYEGLVRNCTIETEDGETICTDPLKFPARSFSDRVPYNCFMINSLKGNPDASPVMTSISAKIHLILDLEIAEYHPSHLSRGAQLSLHTPYHVPSPTADGYFLNLGNIYRMSVKVSDKNLLSYPYKSNCTDYIKQWKANGGDGPVTERMCREKCKLDLSLAMYNCVDNRVDYPHNLTYCTNTSSHFLPYARNRCGDQCSSPCKIRQYVVQITNSDSEVSRKACIGSSDFSCLIIVHISFDNMEVTTFTYKPSFEPIGILSFIGGYVGLWLGISLLTVYDFIETRLFRFIARINKKLWKKKSKVATLSPLGHSVLRFQMPLRFQRSQIAHKSGHKILYV